MYSAARPALERILRIDRQLRAGAWPNSRTLATELEVDARTIQRDIEFMRDRLGAPLRFSRRENGYCYSADDYHLPYFHLTEGELLAFFLAERFMHQCRGLPFEDDLKRAVARITELLPREISVNLEDLSESLSIRPTVVPIQDAETFHVLSQAVLHRRRVEMEYWTASRDEVNRRDVDPYHLTQIEQDWYLIGHCHLRREVRMFSTVRVRAVQETGESFDRPESFRLEEYLGDSFRAIRGNGQQHEVLLRFTAEAAGRVTEKLWHRSQEAESLPDGRLLVGFRVSDLREIKRWVLWWGADCEVLGPGELRDGVEEEVGAMSEIYERRR